MSIRSKLLIFSFRTEIHRPFAGWSDKRAGIDPFVVNSSELQLGLCVILLDLLSGPSDRSFYSRLEMTALIGKSSMSMTYRFSKDENGEKPDTCLISRGVFFFLYLLQVCML